MMTMVMVVVGDVATDASTEGGMFRRNDLLLFLVTIIEYLLIRENRYGNISHRGDFFIYRTVDSTRYHKCQRS